MIICQPTQVGMREANPNVVPYGQDGDVGVR